MPLKQEYRSFASQLAASIIAQDFQQAWAYLAPWLQTQYTPEKLQEAIEKQIAEVCESMEVDLVKAPKAFDLDSNSLSISELRDTVESSQEWMPDQPEIPAEITDDNFRQWMVITFTPAPEDESEVDAWMDFWFSIVELDGHFKVGHFNIEDPD